MEAIQKVYLADSVIQHIQKQISDGILKSGDMLPSGWRLALDLGVSRTVIRQALDQMVAKNIIAEKSAAAFLHISLRRLFLLLNQRRYRLLKRQLPGEEQTFYKKTGMVPFSLAPYQFCLFMCCHLRKAVLSQICRADRHLTRRRRMARSGAACAARYS